VRVHLRRLAAADGERVLAWRNTPEVSTYMYSDHRIGAEEHARWLASALQAGDRRFWIVEMDDVPVGLANLARIDPAASRCEWAFYLADPATRGRGLGACVEYLMLGYVFERLELNKLWCEVLIENAGVWRLHEAFGFTREAVYRDQVRKGGVFRDVVGLGLLRREWPQAKAAAEGRLAGRFELEALSIED
jgi:UDP-4-amino-4,6-dideoxy-N-acetyl-beta-L-altrosamine N-acetyltransferase